MSKSARDVIAEMIWQECIVSKEHGRKVAPLIISALESAGRCIMPMEPTEKMLTAARMIGAAEVARKLAEYGGSVVDVRLMYQQREEYLAAIAARPREQE